MNRITFLNRFYWPEEPATAQLLADLAEALAARGRTVRVLASHPGGDEVATNEVRHGVEIRRARSLRVSGRGKFAKLINWAAFFTVSLWRVARDTRSGDTLVVLTDPPLLAALAAPLAKCRGARVVHWVQDIYPDLAQALGAARGMGWLRSPRNRAWRRAEACVTPGEDMAALVREQGVTAERVRVIPNWAPQGLSPVSEVEINAVRAEWGGTEKFIVVYSGNLGRVHDLEPIIELAVACQNESTMLFLVIGDGAQRELMEKLAVKRRLANLQFLPSAPRAQLAASLSAADVHLVTLKADCARFVFPSKLIGVAAVARPVLFIGPPDSEPAKLVVNHGFGAAHAREQVPAMVTTLCRWRDDTALRRQLGRAGLNYAAKIGLPYAANQWEVLLNS